MMSQPAPTPRTLHIRTERVRQRDLTFYVIALAGDDNSPATLNVPALKRLGQQLRNAQQEFTRAAYDFLVITGTSSAFCAGADLGVASEVVELEEATRLGQIGHETFGQLLDFPAPTIALLPGLAVGGGLELALHCDYRVSAMSAKPIGLPEVSLGIVPGWGGSFLLPHLVGIEQAIDLIITGPVRGRMGVSATQAHEIGLVDFLLPNVQTENLSQAVLDLASCVDELPKRPRKHWEGTSLSAWLPVISAASQRISSSAPVPPSAFEALKLLEIAAQGQPASSRIAEVEALASSLISPEAKSAIYASSILRSARKRTHEYASLDLPWQKVGIVGAGAMALQIALAITSRLQVPVYLKDIDTEQVERARQQLEVLVGKFAQRNQLTESDAQHLHAQIQIGTQWDQLSDADFVLEAVVENLDVKKEVFAQLDQVVSPSALLATNTSALSVTDIAQVVQRPERVAGIHFFNPVDRMPLVEVITSPHTDAQSIQTAQVLVAKLGKTSILVKDFPGFVVNRLLLRYLGVSLHALERHTPPQVVIETSRILGLPMDPLALTDLVGPHICADVLAALRTDLGPRFYHSPGLETLAKGRIPFYVADVTVGGQQRAPKILNTAALEAFGSEIVAPDTVDQLVDVTGRSLAEEVSLMMADGVVGHISDIDVGMILGAGWPTFRGGITPYLRQIGQLQSDEKGS